MHPGRLRRWLASFKRRPAPDAWHDLAIVEPGHPVRHVCMAGVALTCVSGTAWITTGSDTRDVVLGPGERHVAAGRARLFINGMPRCVLRIEPASPR
jgi:hypothetical protein